METPAQLMVIFSLGGLKLRRHLRAGAIRCCTGFVALDGRHVVVLDPFPARGSRGMVVDGHARLWRDDVEVVDDGANGLRWSDLELVSFAASTLWSWLALPRRVEGAGPGRYELDGGEHVLWVGEDWTVIRHEERSTGYVHELSDHCQLEGALVATRRRTHDRHGVPLLWADVVAGHALQKPLNPLPPRADNSPYGAETVGEEGQEGS